MVAAGMIPQIGFFSGIIEQLNGSSIVFLAFAMGETASPNRSVGECKGGMKSPKAKSLRK
jgi:hypothetical protein